MYFLFLILLYVLPVFTFFRVISGTFFFDFILMHVLPDLKLKIYFMKNIHENLTSILAYISTIKKLPHYIQYIFLCIKVCEPILVNLITAH